MKLWSVIWTRPTDRLASARVAAADKAQARMLLDIEDAAGEPVYGDPYADGVIVQFAGNIDAEPAVISVTPR
jgi:hypothetical protein